MKTRVADAGALELDAAKQALRAQMRSLRAAESPASRTSRSLAACLRLQESPWFLRAQVVGGYLALASELDVGALLHKALALGKTVALPRVLGDRLVFHAWQGQTVDLKRSTLGIAEPEASAPLCPPTQLELLLLPALAVDESGGRLGYGGGFYDRLLGTSFGATTIAVAYDFQLVPNVPMGAGDVRVQGVVTDQRTCPFS